MGGGGYTHRPVTQLTTHVCAVSLMCFKSSYLNPTMSSFTPLMYPRVFLWDDYPTGRGGGSGAVYSQLSAYSTIPV